MKKLIGLLLLLAGCRGSMTPNPPLPAGTQVGAADATGAVTGFFAAAKAQDLQALSTLWGDSLGVIRDRVDRPQLEQRELIMMRCLRHDKYTVTSNDVMQGGKRQIGVQITAGPLTRSTKFLVVPGPNSRWYVERFEMEPVNDICLLKSGPP